MTTLLQLGVYSFKIKTHYWATPKWCVLRVNNKNGNIKSLKIEEENRPKETCPGGLAQLAILILYIF